MDAMVTLAQYTLKKQAPTITAKRAQNALKN